MGDPDEAHAVDRVEDDGSHLLRVRSDEQCETAGGFRP
jgi:hypothetical protein